MTDGLEATGETGTGCVCQLAGWCARHRCEKTARLVELCRTRGDYFEQFERGQTPQQRAARWRGLGDLLDFVFRRSGIAWLWYRMPGKPCGCGDRQETLNRWWPFS